MQSYKKMKNEERRMMIFFCNFAAVNVMMKRYIASWVLLAVYLPMLLISSLHIHGTSMDGETTCAECVQHQCHGHLSQLSGGMHQCVLCQFLTLPCVATVVGTIACYLSPKNIFCAARSQAIRLTACGIISLRAPPAA